MYQISRWFINYIKNCRRIFPAAWKHVRCLPRNIMILRTVLRYRIHNINSRAAFRYSAAVQKKKLINFHFTEHYAAQQVCRSCPNIFPWDNGDPTPHFVYFILGLLPKARIPSPISLRSAGEGWCLCLRSIDSFMFLSALTFLHVRGSSWFPEASATLPCTHTDRPIRKRSYMKTLAALAKKWNMSHY